MGNGRKEKDVISDTSVREDENKKSNLQHKILPGYVRAEHVRCGKLNCKCARGQLHGPYHYRYTWADGRRIKTYVRPEDLKATQTACIEYRSLQISLRHGRRAYKALLARVRELFGGI